ncbi:hypothetical protein TNCV_1700091 [Trichonephila clavipes]|nr:hypothetical protein TNCV_1700091 [Trichonephila clavipes]
MSSVSSRELVSSVVSMKSWFRGSGVTENLSPPPCKIRFWALSRILQRVSTWCQSGLGPLKTMGPPAMYGGVRYATGPSSVAVEDPPCRGTNACCTCKSSYLRGMKVWGVRCLSRYVTMAQNFEIC